MGGCPFGQEEDRETVLVCGSSWQSVHAIASTASAFGDLPAPTISVLNATIIGPSGSPGSGEPWSLQPVCGQVPYTVTEYAYDFNQDNFPGFELFTYIGSYSTGRVDSLEWISGSAVLAADE